MTVLVLHYIIKIKCLASLRHTKRDRAESERECAKWGTRSLAADLRCAWKGKTIGYKQANMDFTRQGLHLRDANYHAEILLHQLVTVISISPTFHPGFPSPVGVVKTKPKLEAFRVLLNFFFAVNPNKILRTSYTDFLIWRSESNLESVFEYLVQASQSLCNHKRWNYRRLPYVTDFNFLF